MNLHEDKKLFADIVFAMAEYLEINPVFVEKDLLLAAKPDLVILCIYLLLYHTSEF